MSSREQALDTALRNLIAAVTPMAAPAFWIAPRLEEPILLGPLQAALNQATLALNTPQEK